MVLNKEVVMLVLSRKKHEGVWITASNGDRIHVHVAEIRGDKIRLGFDGPLTVRINRDEVQADIDGEAMREAEGA